MASNKMISVIMPIRNERESIEDTLISLLKQDYPDDLIEIIVADGQSDDGTYEIVKELASTYPCIRLITNKKKIVPTGLNEAIKMSKGKVIIRVDAHSVYPNNYISRLVEALDIYGADNVGCVIKTEPYNNSAKCRAIAIGLSSPFGVGNSSFRIGIKEAIEVDTVPFGCFRREVFEDIGFFDEELVRNQDDEFNARMRKNGKKIFLIPDIECSYKARKNYTLLGRMLFQYGLFKPLVNKKLGEISSLRQLVPLLLVLYTIMGVVFAAFNLLFLKVYLAGLSVYFFSLLLISFSQSIVKRKDISLWLNVFMVYPTMHYAYGWGYIMGLKNLLLKKKSSRDFKISR